MALITKFRSFMIIRLALGILNIFAAILVIASNIVVLDQCRKAWDTVANKTDTFWNAIIRVYTILFCFLLLLAEVPPIWGPRALQYLVQYIKFFRSFFIRGMTLFYIGVLTRDSTFLLTMQTTLSDYKYSGKVIQGFGYTVMGIGGAHILFSVAHRYLRPAGSPDPAAANPHMMPQMDAKRPPSDQDLDHQRNSNDQEFGKV